MRNVDSMFWNTSVPHVDKTKRTNEKKNKQTKQNKTKTDKTKQVMKLSAGYLSN